MNGPDAKLLPCTRPATLTANEWSRRLARPHVHNLATLTAPTKHLYLAYSSNKKHLPYIITMFMLFPVGRSPTKPVGGGATPTMKTHNETYSAPGRIQTKQNENET